MVFPLVLLLPSVCVRDQSFRMRQMIFFVLHKMKKIRNGMSECDNLYDTDEIPGNFAFGVQVK